jgi:RimJ/RimL family protein N-acetyltransferase
VSTAEAEVRRDTYPVLVEGRRLSLRDFDAGDLDGTLAIVGDDRVTWHLSFDTKDRAAAEAYLAAAIARAQQQSRPDYYLAVVEIDGGDLVGFVRLGLVGVKAADLGFAIRADRWGRGYAAEASRMMLRFGFDVLGLHRISAACGPDNAASQRLIRTLGMQPEGRIRDHVFTNGAWRDSLTYSLLEHEWREQG